MFHEDVSGLYRENDSVEIFTETSSFCQVPVASSSNENIYTKMFLKSFET